MSDLAQPGTSLLGSSSSDKDEKSPNKRRTYKNKRLQGDAKPTIPTPSPTVTLPPSNDSSVSRYGRTRRPKVDDDYCDIDEVFEPSRTPNRGSKKVSKKKLDITSPKTSDTVNLELKTDEKVLTSELLSISIPDDSVDVSKVLKLVSNKSPTQFSPDSSSFSMRPLKTYANRRKRSQSFEEDNFDFPNYPEELECTFDSDSSENSDDLSKLKDDMPDLKKSDSKKLPQKRISPRKKSSREKLPEEPPDVSLLRNTASKNTSKTFSSPESKLVSPRRKPSPEPPKNLENVAQKVDPVSSEDEMSPQNFASKRLLRRRVQQGEGSGNKSPRKMSPRKKSPQKPVKLEEPEQEESTVFTDVLPQKKPQELEKIVPSKKKTPFLELELEKDLALLKSENSTKKLVVIDSKNNLETKIIAEKSSTNHLDLKKEMPQKNRALILQNEPAQLTEEDKQKLIANLTRKVDKKEFENKKINLSEAVQLNKDKKISDLILTTPKKERNIVSEGNFISELMRKDGIVRTETICGSKNDETPRKSNKIKILKNEIIKQANVTKTESLKTETITNSNINVNQDDVREEKLVKNIVYEKLVVLNKENSNEDSVVESNQDDSKDFPKIVESDQVLTENNLEELDEKKSNQLVLNLFEANESNRNQDTNHSVKNEDPIQFNSNNIDTNQDSMETNSSKIDSKQQDNTSSQPTAIQSSVEDDYESDSSIESPMFEKHCSVESPIFKREDKHSIAQKILDFKLDISEIDLSLFDNGLKYNVSSPITETDIRTEVEKIITETKIDAPNRDFVFASPKTSFVPKNENKNSEKILNFGINTTQELENIEKLPNIFDSDDESKDDKWNFEKQVEDKSTNTEREISVEKELVSSTTIVENSTTNLDKTEEKDRVLSSPDEFDHLPVFTPIKKVLKSIEPDPPTKMEENNQDVSSTANIEPVKTSPLKKELSSPTKKTIKPNTSHRKKRLSSLPLFEPVSSSDSPVLSDSDESERPKKFKENLRKKIAVKKFKRRIITQGETVEKETDTNSKIRITRKNNEIGIKPSVLVEKPKSNFKVGTIVWSRVGTYPYWPALITNEPEIDSHYKYNNRGRTTRLMYHVNFFGDNGRRSWIFSSHIFKFKSKYDLENKYRALKIHLKTDLKPKDAHHPSAYKFYGKVKAKWEAALLEMDSVVDKPIDMRVEHFCSLLKKVKSEKLKRKRDESDDEEEIDSKRVKLERSSKKKETETETEIKTENPSELDDDMPLSDIKPKVKIDVSPISTRKPKPKKLEDLIQENVSIKKRLRPNDSKNISDDSFSDIESLKARSTPSPLPITSKTQKRISLFKGVIKERVCQICLKPDKVLRCKGPCCGLFHIGCDKKSLSAFPTYFEESSNSTVDSKDSVDMILSKHNAEYGKEFSFNALNSKKTDETDSESSKKSQNVDKKVKHDINSNKNDKKLEENVEEVNFPRRNSILLSIAEQIDAKMLEVMESLIVNTKYAESTTDDSSEPEEIEIPKAEPNTQEPPKVVKHVTGEGALQQVVDEFPKDRNFKCSNCTAGIPPPCFACGKIQAKSGDEGRQKCVVLNCGKYYHRECLKEWPQTKWMFKSKKTDSDEEILTCPHHPCHTCISDDPRGPTSKFTNEKLAKCLRCPTTYHISNYCLPAGTDILSTYQILCPKHYDKNRKSAKIKTLPHVNASWCFICAIGGSLICCENCPASFHSECIKLSPPEGSFICEECESGRLPLYNEVVWVKLGAYRWWPAQILFPSDVPENVKNIPHGNGEFVVRFFGSHDHYWVNRGRVFLFQDGDSGQVSSKKSTVDGLFLKAIEEARETHKLVQNERDNRTAEWREGMKPPSYIKIKANRPVGNVRVIDADTSNTTPCDCSPLAPHPCGPDTDCLNRILMTECNPMVCAAGDRCCNQAFEKREYAPVAPFRTSARGWGLKALAGIPKGGFVIEYVGEVIEESEYQKRVSRKHELKDENYYFLTIDKDRMIDAGPKGNVARFMNHSCAPNCETQKWTVNGDTRVGLFSIVEIPAETELTFNYNLECIGEEKKICRCGAHNCSGFIGVKVKDEKRKASKKKKKVVPVPEEPIESVECFICGEMDAVQSCGNKNCDKQYHLNCLNLEYLQEGRWLCPWHSCNFCTKRTTRCCFKCLNSYCPLHSEGFIRYDRTKYVCKEHDIKTKKSPRLRKLEAKRRAEIQKLNIDFEGDVDKRKQKDSVVVDSVENKSVDKIDNSDKISVNNDVNSEVMVVKKTKTQIEETKKGKTKGKKLQKEKIIHVEIKSDDEKIGLKNNEIDIGQKNIEDTKTAEEIIEKPVEEKKILLEKVETLSEATYSSCSINFTVLDQDNSISTEIYSSDSNQVSELESDIEPVFKKIKLTEKQLKKDHQNLSPRKSLRSKEDIDGFEKDSNVAFVEPVPSKILELQSQEKYASSDSDKETNIRVVKMKLPRMKLSLKKLASSEDEKSDNFELLDSSIPKEQKTVDEDSLSLERESNLEFVQDSKEEISKNDEVKEEMKTNLNVVEPTDVLIKKPDEIVSKNDSLEENSDKTEDSEDKKIEISSDNSSQLKIVQNETLSKFSDATPIPKKKRGRPRKIKIEEKPKEIIEAKNEVIRTENLETPEEESMLDTPLSKKDKNSAIKEEISSLSEGTAVISSLDEGKVEPSSKKTIKKRLTRSKKRKEFRRNEDVSSQEEEEINKDKIVPKKIEIEVIKINVEEKEISSSEEKPSTVKDNEENNAINIKAEIGTQEVHEDKEETCEKMPSTVKDNEENNAINISAEIRTKEVHEDKEERCEKMPSTVKDNEENNAINISAEIRTKVVHEDKEEKKEEIEDKVDIKEDIVKSVTETPVEESKGEMKQVSKKRKIICEEDEKTVKSPEDIEDTQNKSKDSSENIATDTKLSHVIANTNLSDLTESTASSVKNPESMDLKRRNMTRKESPEQSKIVENATELNEDLTRSNISDCEQLLEKISTRIEEPTISSNVSSSPPLRVPSSPSSEVPKGKKNKKRKEDKTKVCEDTKVITSIENISSIDQPNVSSESLKLEGPKRRSMTHKKTEEQDKNITNVDSTVLSADLSSSVSSGSPIKKDLKKIKGKQTSKSQTQSTQSKKVVEIITTDASSSESPEIKPGPKRRSMTQKQNESNKIDTQVEDTVEASVTETPEISSSLKSPEVQSGPKRRSMTQKTSEEEPVKFDVIPDIKMEFKSPESPKIKIVPKSKAKKVSVKIEESKNSDIVSTDSSSESPKIKLESKKSKAKKLSAKSAESKNSGLTAENGDSKESYVSTNLSLESPKIKTVPKKSKTSKQSRHIKIIDTDSSSTDSPKNTPKKSKIDKKIVEPINSETATLLSESPKISPKKSKIIKPIEKVKSDVPNLGSPKSAGPKRRSMVQKQNEESTIVIKVIEKTTVLEEESPKSPEIKQDSKRAKTVEESKNTIALSTEKKPENQNCNGPKRRSMTQKQSEESKKVDDVTKSLETIVKSPEIKQDKRIKTKESKNINMSTEDLESSKMKGPKRRSVKSEEPKEAKEDKSQVESSPDKSLKSPGLLRRKAPKVEESKKVNMLAVVEIETFSPEKLTNLSSPEVISSLKSPEIKQGPKRRSMIQKNSEEKKEEEKKMNLESSEISSSLKSPQIKGPQRRSMSQKQTEESKNLDEVKSAAVEVEPKLEETVASPTKKSGKSKKRTRAEMQSAVEKEDILEEARTSKVDSPKKKGIQKKSKKKEDHFEESSEKLQTNEVKLTSNVPQRHLRVMLRKNLEIESKNDTKFIKMQDEIEKDLPIRKRSKLRYESHS